MGVLGLERVNHRLLVSFVKFARTFIKDCVVSGMITAKKKPTSLSRKAWLIDTDTAAPSRAASVERARRCWTSLPSTVSILTPSIQF